LGAWTRNALIPNAKRQHLILIIGAMVYRAVSTHIARVATVLKAFAQAKLTAAQMFSVTQIDAKDPFAH
jgi:hypothetical protein